MKFKIMFDDLSEKKQQEFLKLAGLKSRDELSNKYPITTLDVDPKEFMTEEEFHEKVKRL